MTSNNSLEQAASSIFKSLEFNSLLHVVLGKNKTCQTLPWNKTGIPCQNSSLFIDHGFLLKWSSPGGSAGKESACNVGDLGSIPGLGRFPGKGKGYTHPRILAWRIPCGLYGPWDRKESDTTERLTLSLSLFFPYCMQKSKSIRLFATSFCLFLLFILPTW